MPKKSIQCDLSPEQSAKTLDVLEARFECNMNRHQNIEWSEVRTKLSSSLKKLKILYDMEQSGGEPDVVGIDQETGEYLFMDCSPESPLGRRSLCYDRQGLESRKENQPKGNAIETAVSMGIELLTEEQYRHLQSLGEFDSKTSSWIKTPPAVRALGGALFADFRYGQVFVYHNGAQSYFGVRGFRGVLKI
jgi:hypothetical protein